MKLLAYLIRYTNKTTRDEIIRYSFEMINSKLYFTRRMFFPYFEKIIELYSTNFIIEHSFLEKITRFLADNTIALINLFKLLPKFYLVVSNDSKLKNQLEMKMKLIKQESNDKELLQVFIAY